MNFELCCYGSPLCGRVTQWGRAHYQKSTPGDQAVRWRTKFPSMLVSVPRTEQTRTLSALSLSSSAVLQSYGTGGSAPGDGPEEQSSSVKERGAHGKHGGTLATFPYISQDSGKDTDALAVRPGVGKHIGMGHVAAVRISQLEKDLAEMEIQLQVPPIQHLCCPLNFASPSGRLTSLLGWA